MGLCRHGDHQIEGVHDVTPVIFEMRTEVECPPWLGGIFGSIVLSQFLLLFFQPIHLYNRPLQFNMEM